MPPKKKKVKKRRFPKGTKPHTFPQRKKSFWKKLTKKKRPRMQLLLQPLFLVTVTLVVNSIVMVTRTTQGIGRGHSGITSAVRADAKEKADKEVKANSERVIQE